MKEIGKFTAEMMRIYTNKHVSRSAAAFAYFLTLALFPLLICVYLMIGRFFPGISDALMLFDAIIPEESLSTLQSYLAYIGHRNDSGMVTAGIVLMATTCATGYRSLNNIMADIHGSPRYTGFFEFLISFFFSVALLVSIYLGAVVVVAGQWLISFIEEQVSFIDVSGTWLWMRFVLLSLILVVMLFGIYASTAPRKAKLPILPGAAVATITLVIVSMIFSEFISVSTRYPLVYGTLTSIIILMLWLYLCGNIIIMGNAFNVVLMRRKERAAEVGEIYTTTTTASQ